jgi:HK97 family phage major capsid protein
VTIAQQIGRLNRDIESNVAQGDFFELARLLALSRGNVLHALDTGKKNNARARVLNILQKTAVTGAAVADWGAIADYKIVSTAFSESLRTLSVFDAILPYMVPAPLRSRGVTVTTGITGATVNESQVKLISKLVLGSSLVEPSKAAAIIVVSQELLKLSDPAANGLFNTELQKAVVAATDLTFLTALIAATTPSGSAGSTLANIVADLGTLLAAVTSGPNSKLFFVCSPANMKKLALKGSSTGAPAFPNLGPNGGEIIPGVTAIPSDEITATAALMIAADGLAGSADLIALDASRQTLLQMDTAPDSPPTASTVPISLWQHDLAGLKAERFFGFVIHRATSVASLSGVSY